MNNEECAAVDTLCKVVIFATRHDAGLWFTFEGTGNEVTDDVFPGTN